MNTQQSSVISQLQQGNRRFQDKNTSLLAQHLHGQSPLCAVLTCSDSRVIPEFIFDAQIGELFVVRDAGNIACDPTVISSLEYAVDHLHVPLLLILAHTHCGAVKVAEEGGADTTSELIAEIQKGFELDPKDHVRGNLLYQLQMLPTQSTVIAQAIENNQLVLQGAIYYLIDGSVSFLEKTLETNQSITG